MFRKKACELKPNKEGNLNYFDLIKALKEARVDPEKEEHPVKKDDPVM